MGNLYVAFEKRYIWVARFWILDVEVVEIVNILQREYILAVVDYSEEMCDFTQKVLGMKENRIEVVYRY